MLSYFVYVLKNVIKSKIKPISFNPPSRILDWHREADKRRRHQRQRRHEVVVDEVDGDGEDDGEDDDDDPEELFVDVDERRPGQGLVRNLHEQPVVHREEARRKVHDLESMLLNFN